MPSKTTDVVQNRSYNNGWSSPWASQVHRRWCVSNWQTYPGKKTPRTDLPNPHTFSTVQCNSRPIPHEPSRYWAGAIRFGDFSGSLDPTQPWPASGLYHSVGGGLMNRLENEASAKFAGKLRKGHADLGVTLGSWKQSRDMLIHRLERTSTFLTRHIGLFEKNPHLVRRTRRYIEQRIAAKKEPLANVILETKFGWQPLVQDIGAALGVLGGELPPTWIRAAAKGRGAVTLEDFPTGDGKVKRTTGYEEDLRVVLTARVALTNPNLYMLNQLGLINPVTVVWDLIPWSFVVNMFVNVNQLISQFTDEVGLTVTDRSLTRSWSVSHVSKIIDPNPYPAPPVGTYSRYDQEHTRKGRAKTRTLITSNPVHWQVRVPELDWGLAITASALVLQKFKRLNQIIGVPT